uniref:B box-type domain-containing protein n=1 Tax=Manihot esculenta TaxID=3983 RepID=A0A199UA02_MANES
MEPLCEFCGVVRAVVYYKSDSTRLCLNCDGFVHSANCLSRRHYRSLLCNKCNSQSAILLCLDDKLSICQTCDSNSTNGCSSSGHRLQVLSSYTGRPSLAEFSRIWSFVLDASPSTTTRYDPEGLGTTSLPSLQGNEDSIISYLKNNHNESSFGLVTSKLNELEPWMGTPNTGCSNFKDLKIQDGEDLCEGNMDDVALNFENGDDIFECLQDCITFHSPQVTYSTSMIHAMYGSTSCLYMNSSCNRRIKLGFPTASGQIHSSISLSLSNITGESSAADYQDCGLSPVFLASESPWKLNLETSCPQAKDKAKMRYKEKKKTRIYIFVSNSNHISG